MKRFYARTNKRKTFGRQIAKQQRRERILKQIRERWKEQAQQLRNTGQPNPASVPCPAPNVSFEDSDPLPKTLPEVHHHISNTTRLKENIYRWVYFHKQNSDEAIKVRALVLCKSKSYFFSKDFIPNLKDHILSRLLGHAYDGDEVEYSEEDRDSIEFANNMLYRHKVLRINYTTYDLRRQQDSVNPRTHPDIILLSHEEPSNEVDAHPYWYARVIGIFHVDIVHSGAKSTSPDKRRIDFLWIRWFGRDISFKAGWIAKRLHRLGFLDASGSHAFGFLDPALAIRGLHLIPAFAHGQTAELLSPAQSVARLPLQEDSDWRYYYVNM